MSDTLFWRNRIVDSGSADPQELAKGYNSWNWRHHPQIQRDALEDALDSIGVLQPVLFNRSSGRVIDGHLRIELAILKGQPLIPVNYVELTDDEEALALATLDAITEQAEPIPDKLAALLERTRQMTADRPGLGAMLAALKERAGINGHQPKEDAGPQLDKAAELQKVWGVKVGDVWELGRHRLVCGDCTDRATVEAVMRWERADCIWTDPPYGVNYKGGAKERDSIENDDDVTTASDGLRTVSEFIRNGGVIYCAAPPKRLFEFWQLFLSAGFHYSMLLVWIKNNMAGGWADYRGAYEHIFYGWKAGSSHYWCGARDKSTVFLFDKPQSSIEHPTIKPVGLVQGQIQNSTRGNELVLDPFLGSGTTLIACEQLGRRCRAIEIDPSYCSVTLQRFVDAGGQTPRRVPSGDCQGLMSG